MVQNISDTREMWIYLVGFCQSTDTYSSLNWMNHCVDMLVCGRNEYVYICIVWSSCFGDVPTLRATFAGILHWWLYPKFLYRFQSKVAQIHWLWSILTIAISVSIGIAISFYFLQTLDFFYLLLLNPLTVIGWCTASGSVSLKKSFSYLQ